MNTKAIIILAVGLILALWLGKTLFSKDSGETQLPQVSPVGSTPFGAPQQTGQGTPQPPGEAPPGKVWNAQHGHWHDAPGTPPGQAGQLTAQPPGEAPPGKMWNAEHGHWHDLPPGQSAATAIDTVGASGGN